MEPLDSFVKYFEKQMALYKSELPNVGDVDKIYRQYFQSILWILYLGDPNDWANLYGRSVFEEIDYKRYKIEVIGL
jgi:hypothetical protein